MPPCAAEIHRPVIPRCLAARIGSEIENDGVENVDAATYRSKRSVASIRTAVAAVGSLLIARFCRLPEPYWAAVTTIVVMQSTLGAAWTVSKERFAGTALGAAMGALLTAYAEQNAAAFGAGVFVLGLICALLRIGRNAFRYAGITLAVVMLVARAEPAWMIAIHRFLEISVGNRRGTATDRRLAGA